MFFRIKEFANLAGVTVRTLQYYDRLGLLKPSHLTEGGHRLYRREDLLRLQQILTLKWMGFALDQIKEVLESDPYDLHTALRIQKGAIDTQITRLQTASSALERALNADELEQGLLEAETIQAVIQAVTQDDWAQQYYSDAAWAGIVTRRMQYTEADFAQFHQDWQSLSADFAAVCHLPPAHPDVQTLAETMASYIELFTAGDAETTRNLRDLWQNNPPSDPSERELREFMQAALKIYQEGI